MTTPLDVNRGSRSDSTGTGVFNEFDIGHIKSLSASSSTVVTPIVSKNNSPNNKSETLLQQRRSTGGTVLDRIQAIERKGENQQLIRVMTMNGLTPTHHTTNTNANNTNPTPPPPTTFVNDTTSECLSPRMTHLRHISAPQQQSNTNMNSASRQTDGFTRRLTAPPTMINQTHQTHTPTRTQPHTIHEYQSVPACPATSHLTRATTMVPSGVGGSSNVPPVPHSSVSLCCVRHAGFTFLASIPPPPEYTGCDKLVVAPNKLNIIPPFPTPPSIGSRQYDPISSGSSLQTPFCQSSPDSSSSRGGGGGGPTMGGSSSNVNERVRTNLVQSSPSNGGSGGNAGTPFESLHTPSIHAWLAEAEAAANGSTTTLMIDETPTPTPSDSNSHYSNLATSSPSPSPSPSPPPPSSASIDGGCMKFSTPPTSYPSSMRRLSVQVAASTPTPPNVVRMLSVPGASGGVSTTSSSNESPNPILCLTSSSSSPPPPTSTMAGGGRMKYYHTSPQPLTSSTKHGISLHRHSVTALQGGTTTTPTTTTAHDTNSTIPSIGTGSIVHLSQPLSIDSSTPHSKSSSISPLPPLNRSTSGVRSNFEHVSLDSSSSTPSTTVVGRNVSIGPPVPPTYTPSAAALVPTNTSAASVRDTPPPVPPYTPTPRDRAQSSPLPPPMPYTPKLNVTTPVGGIGTISSSSSPSPPPPVPPFVPRTSPSSDRPYARSAPSTPFSPNRVLQRSASAVTVGANPTAGPAGAGRSMIPSLPSIASPTHQDTDEQSKYDDTDTTQKISSTQMDGGKMLEFTDDADAEDVRTRTLASLTSELEQLSQSLQLAIERQEFEHCIQLRDQIKSIKQQMIDNSSNSNSKGDGNPTPTENGRVVE